MLSNYTKLSDNRSVMWSGAKRELKGRGRKLALWLANRKNDKEDSFVVYRMEDDGGREIQMMGVAPPVPLQLRPADARRYRKALVNPLKSYVIGIGNCSYFP